MKHVSVPVEPDDRILRAILSVTMPATFREHLRHPDNGPRTAADVEKSIEIARKQYAAIIQASQQS